MPPRGSNTAATIGRLWQQHRAGACQTALIFVLASGLASSFGAVVERLTIADTLACTSRAAEVSIHPVVSAPEVTGEGYGPPQAGTARMFRHVVDRQYEDSAAATRASGGLPDNACDVTTANTGSERSPASGPR